MTYYDEISQGYEELYREEQQKKLDYISQFFTPQKDDLLLDVGCGTGVTTRYWDCRRVGIDPAIKLIRRAKNAYYLNGEAEHLPFKDNSFDVVVSITAIQNFHDIKKGLAEIKRVGKERFVLSALKKSEKIKGIRREIQKIFDVTEEHEEDRDIIFII